MITTHELSNTYATPLRSCALPTVTHALITSTVTPSAAAVISAHVLACVHVFCTVLIDHAAVRFTIASSFTSAVS